MKVIIYQNATLPKNLLVFWLQFGKQILAQQVPGWSKYYLDYKGLKKIISSLGSDRPAAEVAALAIGPRQENELTMAVPSSSVAPLTPSSFQSPSEIPADQAVSLFTVRGQDDDRGPDFQAHKTAFFFKLERELEKVAYMRVFPAVNMLARLIGYLDQRLLSSKGSRA